MIESVLLIGALEDTFEILAVFTGSGTINPGMSNMNRKMAQFITSAGSGCVNDTVFAFVFNYSPGRMILPAIGSIGFCLLIVGR